MMFNTQAEVFEFFDAAWSANEDVGRHVVESMGRHGAMYEGVQYVMDRRGPSINPDGTSNTRGMLESEYNPDSRSGVRVINNQLSRLAQKVMAKTYPERIYIKTEPPPNDFGPTAAHRAAVHATVANAAIDASGYLQSSILANERRTIFGVWGVGLTVPTDKDGQQTVEAFDFDPSCLVLDPYVQSPFLEDHLYVAFCETWPVEKARAFLPDAKVDWDKADLISRMEPTRLEWAARTGGRMWSRYAQNSKTKGVRVIQIHCRDAGSARFQYCYTMLEVVKNERVWVNQDNPETPFGGNGMPFALLHAYPRADSVWSWGEPAQMGDDQRRLNLVETMKVRALRAWTDPPAVVHRRWFKNGTTDAEIEDRLSNRSRGVIVLDESPDRQRPLPMPTFMNYPPVPGFLSGIVAEYAESMREKVHLAPGNFGQTQTHVPLGTTNRVLDDADQVASVRVSKDVLAHESLIRTLHATTCRLAQEDSGPVLGMLREAGLDEQDFAVVVSTDWRAPQASIAVLEASFRHRSTENRKQELNQAAAMGMVDPATYQKIMARDLQSPLEDEARLMVMEAQKTAIRVLHGEEYVAEPWGRWGGLIVDQLTIALRDRRAQGDPESKARLQRAIVAQTEMNAAMSMLSQPQAGGVAGTSPQAEEPVAPTSIADILDGATTDSGQ